MVNWSMTLQYFGRRDGNGSRSHYAFVDLYNIMILRTTLIDGDVD